MSPLFCLPTREELSWRLENTNMIFLSVINMENGIPRYPVICKRNWKIIKFDKKFRKNAGRKKSRGYFVIKKNFL